jgi:HlyD family secretion protein
MDIERPDLFKKRRRNQRTLIIVAVVAAVVTTLWIVTLGRPNPQVNRDQVWIGAVQRGDMIRNVRGLGKLVPEDMRWITARASGRVEERLVLSGAEVDPDTVILRLSNPQLEQQYLNAQLEFKAAEAEFVSTRVRLQSELLALRSAHVQLKEQAEMAALEKTINDELFADGLVSELNRKRSELSARHLQSRLVMETERVQFQEEAIEPQLATQQTQVDRAQARLDLLESQIQALTVKAGSRGVLQRLTIEQGMQISEGQELALVSDPSRLKGVIEIQESQAREVRIGQVGLVDTRSSGEVAAVVTRIDPNVERGIVKVDVAFPDGLPEGCRADQTIQGTIELQRLQQIVFMDRPTSAREGTQASLFVLSSDGGRADRVSVDFGRSSVSLIEVLKGLNPGDRVILSDTTRWENARSLDLR